MGHRIQITIEDAQFERMLAESRRTGLGLAELVRRAVDARYGVTSPSGRMRALAASFGGWRLDVDGDRYVESLRRGSGPRLQRG